MIQWESAVKIALQPSIMGERAILMNGKEPLNVHAGLCLFDGESAFDGEHAPVAATTDLPTRH